MRTKNDDVPIGHLIDCFNKHHASAAEIVHHMLVVNDLMEDIDRRALGAQDFIDHLNGHAHASTKPARVG